MTLRFTSEDHTRIAAAIREAERETSGEIYAVFARRSDDHRFAGLAVALALSLVTGFLVSLLAFLAGVALPPLAVESAQLLAGLALFLAFRASPRFAMLFVPRRLAQERASRLARAQFLAHNLQDTAERTGVLLFVSEVERYAEVIADEGIAALVPQSEWDEIVEQLVAAARDDRLVEGFEEAVRWTGALLARNFPPRLDTGNEIPDRLVEI